MWHPADHIVVLFSSSLLSKYVCAVKRHGLSGSECVAIHGHLSGVSFVSGGSTPCAALARWFTAFATDEDSANTKWNWADQMASSVVCGKQHWNITGRNYYSSAKWQCCMFPWIPRLQVTACSFVRLVLPRAPFPSFVKGSHLSLWNVDDLSGNECKKAHISSLRVLCVTTETDVAPEFVQQMDLTLRLLLHWGTSDSYVATHECLCILPHIQAVVNTSKWDKWKHGCRGLREVHSRIPAAVEKTKTGKREIAADSCLRYQWESIR